MTEATIIGLDLAKNVFQAHGARADGSVAFRIKLLRAKVLAFFAAQPTCTVAMEACASAHNVGNDRAQLADISTKAKAVLGAEKLDVVADRGYFDSEEILACDRAGITVTLPKPLTSGVTARGRFGKQDFRYLADEDVYICPAGERLAYHYTNEENGLTLHR